jgi:hypothetical protein
MWSFRNPVFWSADPGFGADFVPLFQKTVKRGPGNDKGRR